MNCSILFLIWRSQLKQARKNLRYRKGWMTTQSVDLKSEMNENRSDRDLTNLDILATNLSKISKQEEKRMQHIRNRAYAFTLGYIFTYFFGSMYRLTEMYGRSEPSFAIVLLSCITIPLQGLINMMIYTYPHVEAYYRNHSGQNCIISWILAFCHVVKSGGDSDTKITRRLSQRRGRPISST